MIKNFFKRINLPENTEIEHTPEFLSLIVNKCVTNIAYENLDILEDKPISLEFKDMYEKIVLKGKGGYCFELNGLLTHILREMEFTVSDRFARYLRGEKEIPMRRHRVSVVKLCTGNYMCDIGVGEIAPREALKIEEGLIQNIQGETYKFEKSDVHGWVLYDLYKGQWREYIAFTEEDQYDVDFIQPSFFCEKHPSSPFNKAPMLAIKTEKGRKTIDGKIYKEFEGTKLAHIEENITEERYRELLKTVFKLKV